MNKKIINEGFDYHDLEGQLEPTVTVDEYSAKMGKDSEIVTIAFIVNGEAVGNDLADWFERGYEWVLDAQVSDGELRPGKFLVFVEMNRRSSVPARIITLLSDLDTLTNIPIEDWTIMLDEKQYKAEEETLKQVIRLSPHEYRVEEEKEGELNEMREIAGLNTSKIYDEQDADIRAFKTIAGL
jgi:hypothetical protein